VTSAPVRCGLLFCKAEQRFSYAFGFAALPSGLLTDRLGTQRVLYLCLGGAGLAGVLVGLSPNVWVLAIGLAALGLAIGLYHPAGISLIAQGVRQRGMALGLHGVAGNLGIAATPLLASVFADAFSWRAAYFFLAGLAVILGLVLRVVSGAARAPVRPPGLGESAADRSSAGAMIRLCGLRAQRFRV
jgi:MFS family permease